MELNQLQYFRTMAHVHHFTKAAKEASISQSALSRSIAKLEDELGVQLFDRTKRDACLTRQGRIFLPHVERALEELETAREELSDRDDEEEGVITLSFPHSLAGHFLPTLLGQFHREHPRMNQHNSAYLAKQLADGTTDLCFCSTIMTTDRVVWNYLWSEELFLVVPKNHPFADRESLTLKDVEKEPLIAMKPSHSLRLLSDQLFETAGSHPQIIFEGNDIHTLAGLVSAGLGVSLIPRLLDTTELNIVFIPVSFPLCRRSIGLAWNTTQQLSPAAIEFQQFIFHHFAGRRGKHLTSLT